MNKINLKKYAFLALTIIAFNTSCSKKEIDYTFIPDKQFTPVQGSSDEKETEVTLEWRPSLNAPLGTTYTIEISTDQSFAAGAEKTFTSEGPKLVLTDSDIDVRVDYYARIKANSVNNTGESTWLVSSKFRIAGEQFLAAAKYDDVLSDEATIKWDATKQVTHVTVNGVKQDDFTPSELASGTKILENLTPATAYKVIIWNNEANKGEINFFTRGVPNGVRVPLNVGDDIKTIIESATSGQTLVFVLPEGSEFISTATIVIPDKVSITIFGEEGPNKPTVKLNTNTGFTLPAESSEIKFQNLTIDGTSSQYIINQSAESAINNLVFENCEIKGFSHTPIRLQQTGDKIITNLKIENCIVKNLSPSQNYAFIHTNIANGIIRNITMTNSTFYNIGLGLILNTGAAGQSLLIDNCTIYDVTKGDNNSRYLITYGALSSGSAEIKNTIFAKTKDANASGILMGNVYSTSNNYQTSDFTVARGAITGITNYSKSSTDLFTDPVNGDFTFKDPDFAGKSTAGDPRWR